MTYNVYKNHLQHKTNLNKRQAVMILENARKEAVEQGDKTIQCFGMGEKMTLCTRNHIYRIERASA